ncbi:MAG: hypothetical protein NTX56_12115 [Proteobacteria bacterium]|nr:hypothetical protein [Pseudomonadota bacterium]
MPIKKENRAKYPANWQEIRTRIRTRSGDKCEWCGVMNGAVGWRDCDGEFVMIGRDPEDAGASCDLMEADGFKIIRIVLTVAHIHDNDPANCADDNLAHLCQRCHNKHDAPMRKVNSARTRKTGKAIADMFGEPS